MRDRARYIEQITNRSVENILDSSRKKVINPSLLVYVRVSICATSRDERFPSVRVKFIFIAFSQNRLLLSLARFKSFALGTFNVSPYEIVIYKRCPSSIPFVRVETRSQCVLHIFHSFIQ